MLATDPTLQPCSNDAVDDRCVVDDAPDNPRPMNTYKASWEFQIYERLCRGEQTHV